MPGGIHFLAPITQLVYNGMWSLALGKRLLVFIDDLNMPQVDTYGTQQPIALLKLLLEKGGMYDRGKDLNWKMFKDIFFTAAMGKVCMCVSIWILQIKWFMSTRLDSSRIAKSIQTMMCRNYAYMYVCMTGTLLFVFIDLFCVDFVGWRRSQWSRSSIPLPVLCLQCHLSFPWITLPYLLLHHPGSPTAIP